MFIHTEKVLGSSPSLIIPFLQIYSLLLLHMGGWDLVLSLVWGGRGGRLATRRKFLFSWKDPMNVKFR